MARIAFACLTAITALAAAPAFAQDAPAAPAAPEAPPAAPEAAAPAPAPPPLPTDGLGARVLQVLDSACLPLIQEPGSDPKAIVRPIGLKDTRDGWQLKEKGVNRLTVRLPNAVNPSSCEITANYDPGQGATLAAALAAWSATQPVPLQQDLAAQTTPGGDRSYTTTNWVGWSPSTRMGLAFTEEKKLDGTPVAKNADQARILLSFRALTEADRQAQ